MPLREDPTDARDMGIETIYQTLALANHLDAPANLFLGRELMTRRGKGELPADRPARNTTNSLTSASTRCSTSSLSMSTSGVLFWNCSSID